MKYIISKRNKILKGTIKLEGSKSISNRVLIIQALCANEFNIQNLSASSDTNELTSVLSALNVHPFRIQEINGGTTFRFLTALLSITKGEWILNGSKRMNKRPIGVLVDALKHLGANIDYLKNKNYPPIRIRGKNLIGKKITVDASESSQYISALLLIAPFLKNGLTIELNNEVVSQSYITMTLNLMQYFGIRYSWKGKKIKVAEQKYVSKNIYIEKDWSGAAYFYEMAVLSENVDLVLKGLKKNTLQGDSVIAEIMKKFGIKSYFSNKGVRLKKMLNNDYATSFNFDFTHHPDLVQPMMVTCAGLGIKAEFSGIKNLKIKESDRVAALKNELKKMKKQLVIEENKVYLLNKKYSPKNKLQVLNFNTHEDHRMAMSLAPLAILNETIAIEHPEVVKKSFPNFWNELERIGFKIKENK